jgi:hypothetical protein
MLRPDEELSAGRAHRRPHDARLQGQPHDGLCLCTANIGSTSQPDGGTRRYVRVVANGTDEVAMRQGRSSLNGTFHSAVTDLVRLAEGDTLDTIVFQDSGYTMSYYGRLTALLVGP